MFNGFIAAAALWVITWIAWGVVGSKKQRSQGVVTPRNILFVGTFSSAAVMFVPIFFEKYAQSDTLPRLIKTILLSVYHGLKLFLVDGEFDLVGDVLIGAEQLPATLCALLAAALFVTAPILTVDYVLSFFKNISSYRKLWWRFFRDLYVFSELNERSLALAQSIVKKDKKNVIVFADVFDKNEERSFELMDEAWKMGAICFKKDIVSINFKFHSKESKLSFFAIGMDDIENVNQSFGVIEHYKERKNTMLYVFSTSLEGELMMAATQKGEIKVRRIKDVRSLIYRTLFEMEETVIEQKATGLPAEEIVPDLFMSARPTEDGLKQIGAVVVGCGLHGKEMVKALTWFCQMDGYRVSIDVFDRDKLMRSKFAAECPELMSSAYNGVYVEGEAQYMIRFHTGSDPHSGEQIGLDVDTIEFANEIKQLKGTTYVFVALGTDEDNIQTAARLRVLFEQMKIHPVIHAVVYNSQKKDALSDIKNFKGQSYDISLVGDLNTLYSEEVIIDSELEQEALQRHLKYGPEETFWQYEYNYRSSMASALHMRARIACGIPGADKREEDLTEAERAAIEPLEHRRWNAYTRSEGYIYSGSQDKKSRNDLGKMHPDLVNFEALSDEKKRMDSRVGTK